MQHSRRSRPSLGSRAVCLCTEPDDWPLARGKAPVGIPRCSAQQFRHLRGPELSEARG